MTWRPPAGSRRVCRRPAPFLAGGAVRGVRRVGGGPVSSPASPSRRRPGRGPGHRPGSVLLTSSSTVMRGLRHILMELLASSALTPIAVSTGRGFLGVGVARRSGGQRHRRQARDQALAAHSRQHQVQHVRDAGLRVPVEAQAGDTAGEQFQRGRAQAARPSCRPPPSGSRPARRPCRGRPPGGWGSCRCAGRTGRRRR